MEKNNQHYCTWVSKSALTGSKEIWIGIDFFLNMHIVWTNFGHYRDLKKNQTQLLLTITLDILLLLLFSFSLVIFFFLSLSCSIMYRQFVLVLLWNLNLKITIFNKIVYFKLKTYCTTTGKWFLPEWIDN